MGKLRLGLSIQLRITKIKIAIYSPNWIGDAVMSIPFVKEIKKEYPQAEVYIICKDWVVGIFENHQSINGIISFPLIKLKGIKNIIKTGLVLKSEKFDLSYTLTDSFRSAFILWISGAKKRVGFKTQNRSLFLTDPVPVPIQIMHRSNKYLTLTKHKFIDQISPQFFLLNHEKNWAKQKIKDFGLSSPTALLPFSVGEGRSLSISHIKKWIKNSKKDYLIFGSKNDAGSGISLETSCTENSIKSICGEFTLRESIALINLCSSSIATDSGLGHISAALGTPTISFFGKGNSNVTAPKGLKTHVIQHCNPCFGDRCSQQEGDLICIEDISCENVENALKKLIEQ